MKKPLDLKEIYKYYIKQYRRFIPDFYADKNRIDVFPLFGFYNIYENTENIEKFGPRAYFDKKTGWMYIIVDKYGFKKARKFYTQEFPNKRPAKRYIFGLKSNKKTVLCAIATHVSAKVEEQKHNSTKRYLTKAKRLAREIIHKDKNEFYFNMRRIDSVILKFVSKKKIFRYKPSWYRIYQLAYLSKVFWKGI